MSSRECGWSFFDRWSLFHLFPIAAAFTRASTGVSMCASCTRSCANTAGLGVFQDGLSFSKLTNNCSRYPPTMITPQDVGFAAVIKPTLPNFFLCDPRYGINLEIPSCISAASQLPLGKSNVPYAVNTSGARFALPWSMAVGQ